jgi:hypothetical protein
LESKVVALAGLAHLQHRGQAFTGHPEVGISLTRKSDDIEFITEEMVEMGADEGTCCRIVDHGESSPSMSD